jgi:CRP-like cAMP-binding protein
MRILTASALLLLLIPSIARAAKPVTIAQLDQILLADRGQSDGHVAGQLANLTLTERVTVQRLAS